MNAERITDLNHKDGREPLLVMRMPVDVDLLLGVQRAVSKSVPGLGSSPVDEVLTQHGNWLCLYRPTERAEGPR